ncbi:MAG: hypothetical protein Ct9H300mP14_15200 [Gammaproteobacteria bacterium]|nr:MAG: hypothetical protein Ct9H300mP14_15200 [Gammaproteobacteria bacterium]
MTAAGTRTEHERYPIVETDGRTGLCSRREADRLIEQGKVLVNGQVIDRLGSRFDPTVCIALAPEIQRSVRVL